MFALSEPLVRYSAQLKQYSTDVAFALALALLALSFLTAQPSVLRTAGFAATGLVAVWFSHASLFVLTAAALSLAAVYLSRGGSAPRSSISEPRLRSGLRDSCACT